MIINSDYHDYYDGVVKSTGTDKSMVLNRKESEVKFNDIKNQISESLKEKLIFLRERVSGWYENDSKIHSYQCVIFCGKVYWLQSKKNSDYVNSRNPENDDINISVTWEPSAERKIERWSWRSEIVTSTVTETWDLSELCVILNSSVIVINGQINPNFENATNMSFSLYPQLKRYNFQRLVDPYTAYQEIQMFNFGVLSQNKEPEVLCDKSRIVAAGFDLKSSFRNVK